MNVVVLGGNLTADPELRYTGSGTAVATMRLAVSGFGEKDEAMFINVTAWERLADVCAERLRKGNKIVVHGRLLPEEWTAKDGSKRSTFSVRATSVEFMQKGAADNGAPEVKEEAPRALHEPVPEPTGLPF